MLRNAKQILTIVTATFSPTLFDEDKPSILCSPSSDIEGLGCNWSLIMELLREVPPDSDEGLDRVLAHLEKVTSEAFRIDS